ncbi:hypothetical protein N9W84_00985 [bacterium]|nr:hypothetical protein [bacterium]
MYSVFKGSSYSLKDWGESPHFQGMKEVQEITGLFAVERRVCEYGYLVAEIEYDKLSDNFIGKIYKPGSYKCLKDIFCNTIQACKFKVDLYLKEMGYSFSWN